MNENIKMAQDILKLQAERTSFKTMAEYVRDYLVAYAETDSEFVQKVQDKEKDFVKCISYIKRKAMEWLREEAMMEVADYGIGIGGDVPDKICFLWAVEYYFSKPEEKKIPEPKANTNSTSKRNKAKKVEKEVPKDSQLSFMDIPTAVKSEKSTMGEAVADKESTTAESESIIKEETPKDDNIIHLKTADSSLDYPVDDCDAEKPPDGEFPEDFFIEDFPYGEVN